jgi:hypothetical protein
MLEAHLSLITFIIIAPLSMISKQRRQMYLLLVIVLVLVFPMNLLLWTNRYDAASLIAGIMLFFLLTSCVIY